MSIVQWDEYNELDEDWVQLMLRARELGYSTDEVRKILGIIQENRLNDSHKAYA